MEANELRLGNLIIEDGKQTEFNGDFYHWIDGLIKPILLTEQWLINLGFRKNKDDIRFWRKGSLKIKNTEKGFKFNYSESITYIESVHQLQNLYFALEGVELELLFNVA